MGWLLLLMLPNIFTLRNASVCLLSPHTRLRSNDISCDTVAVMLFVALT